MNGILRAPHIWIAAALWGGFWLVAWVVPRAWLFDAVNALTISIGAGVLVAYAPGVRASLARRDLSGGHYLVMGIAVAWAATTARHAYNWLWRYLGQPDDMINHPFVAFLIWMLFTAGLLHLLARDAIEGQIPPRNWVTVGISVAVGLALALGFIVWLEPSPHH